MISSKHYHAVCPTFWKQAGLRTFKPEGSVQLAPKAVLFEQQSTRTSRIDQTNSQKTSCWKETSSSADRALVSPTSLLLIPAPAFLSYQANRNWMQILLQIRHLSFTCCFKTDHAIRLHEKRKQTFRAAVWQVVSQRIRQRLNRTNQFRPIMHLSTLKRKRERNYLAAVLYGKSHYIEVIVKIKFPHQWIRVSTFN